MHTSNKNLNVERQMCGMYFCKDFFRQYLSTIKYFGSVKVDQIENEKSFSEAG